VALAHYLAGLSWGISCVIGGLFIITGPTVVMPLLQQNKIKSKISSVLKWEAIVNDPVGALIAVFAFEYLLYVGSSTLVESSPLLAGAEFMGLVVLIAAMSVAAAQGLKLAFSRGMVPEYLKQPTILTVVIFLFAVSDVMQKEGGLIAVTAFGIALANMKFPSYHDTKRFKEYIAILLVGVIFILISSTLRFDMMLELDPGAIIFVVLAIFVTRPLSILVATIGGNLSLKERLFLGWIAPRGIVCAVTAGLVAPKLLAAGYTDAALILPITFLMIFATVLLHGFSIGILAKRLDLAQHEHGVMIVGSNAFSLALAKAFTERKVPVMIVDTNWHQLKQPRMADIPVFYGEVLSEDALYAMEMERYSYLILATPNMAYNALVGTNYLHHFGRSRIFHVDIELEKDTQQRNQFDHSLKGPVIADGYALSDLIGKALRSWRIKAVNLTEEYTYDQHLQREDEKSIPLFMINTKTGLMREVKAEIGTEKAVAAKREKDNGFTLICLVEEDEAALAKTKADKNTRILI